MQPSSAGCVLHEMAGWDISQQQHSTSSAGGSGSVVGSGMGRVCQTVGASSGHTTSKQAHCMTSTPLVQEMTPWEMSQQQHGSFSSPEI
jgi:hypothetical protein